MTANRRRAMRCKLEFECFPPDTLRLDEVDLSRAWPDKESYEDELKKLQQELLKLQIKIFLKARRAIFVFEGWDAAGKGGAIKRLTMMMDPRGYKVWPIGPPKDEEVRQHYLWRFWERLPDKGEIAVFDRSWYGRVLVERVEGFASDAEWRRAYDEINVFERMLTSDGVQMAKFFLHIDRKTQLERFKQREHDAMKRYKITPDDWRNRKKWKDYEEAVQDMLDRTHRPDAPWYLIPANDKHYARIEILKTCIAVLTR